MVATTLKSLREIPGALRMMELPATLLPGRKQFMIRAAQRGDQTARTIIRRIADHLAYHGQANYLHDPVVQNDVEEG